MLGPMQPQTTTPRNTTLGRLACSAEVTARSGTVWAATLSAALRYLGPAADGTPLVELELEAIEPTLQRRIDRAASLPVPMVVASATAVAFVELEHELEHQLWELVYGAQLRCLDDSAPPALVAEATALRVERVR